VGEQAEAQNTADNSHGGGGICCGRGATAAPESEIAKLTASDAAASDHFGFSVSVSGDTAVVGAQRDIPSGSAYIFVRDEGGVDNWGEVAKLTASDAGVFDAFGAQVAISGDTTVVVAFGDDDAGGSSGSAYIFERDQGGVDNWGQVAKLIASDAAVLDFFGRSVSVSGDTAVV